VLAPDYEELRLLLTDLERFDVEYKPLPPDVSALELLIGISRALLAGNYHLVHSQGLAAGMVASVPLFILRCPHLVTVHNILNEWEFTGVRGCLKKFAFSLVLPLIDRIHAVSYDARENLLEYVPSLRVLKKKVIAVLNGIEISRFSGDEKLDLRNDLNLPADSFLIGFFGRFMPQKGFVYLADAVHHLLRRADLPRQPFVVAFDTGRFIKKEKIDLQRKGIDGHFKFMPFVPNIASALRGLDVVAMPSLWEGCGLVAIEAMVAGVPVVGSDCIGLREVLRDTPCITVPVRDSVRLADALLNEMNNPTVSAVRAFRSEACSRFDVRNQAKRLEGIMTELIGRAERAGTV
jgi:glycosyltransferase involved in cell wall biosynthesis